MAVSSQTRNINVDLRIVSLILLAIIGVMLVIWKPWTSSASDRTVEVTGEVKLKEKPDEFVFYPTYEFKHKDKDAALKALTKKSDQVVAKLKALGVADSKIQTTSSGHDYPIYFDKDSNEQTYTLQLNITLDSLDLAQKVQDYLISTTPTGSVSPQANFSEAKRKELESKARVEATKDARAQADQMAHNLGFKVGKVKSVIDGAGFDVIPYYSTGREIAVDSAAGSSLAVQPGENELNYSVTVTYYIR